jgi:hypothetical protein
VGCSAVYTGVSSPTFQRSIVRAMSRAVRTIETSVNLPDCNKHTNKLIKIHKLTSLHGAVTHRTAIFLLTALTTSHFAKYKLLRELVGGGGGGTLKAVTCFVAGGRCQFYAVRSGRYCCFVVYKKTDFIFCFLFFPSLFSVLRRFEPRVYMSAGP